VTEKDFLTDIDVPAEKVLYNQRPESLSRATGFLEFVRTSLGTLIKVHGTKLYETGA
jgi:hypothetical protein